MTSLFNFKYCFVFIAILFSITLKAQDASFVIPDSLVNISYDSLFDRYIKVYQDTLKSEVYLNTIYKKALIDDNDLQKAKALSNLAYYKKDKIYKKELIDLSIYHAKKSSDLGYLMLCYSFAGGYYLNFFEYDKALDFYLKSLSVAQKIGDQNYIFINKHNIALIKSDIGNFSEALKLLKECYDREISLGDKSFTYDYLSTSLYLSETFIRTNQQDSANYYIKRALRKVSDDHSSLKSQLIVYKSLSNKQKSNIKYNDVITSLNNLNKENNESKRILLLGNYYAAFINKKNSFKHYKTVDSIFQNDPFLIPEVRMSYEQLIKYYKKQKDSENQLLYVDKILKFDSIYSIQKQTLGAKIFSLYDTPTLVSKKEELIQILDKKNNKLNYWTIILILLVLALIIISLYLYLRARKHKNKFNKLINTTDVISVKNPKTENVKEPTSKINKKELLISPEIVSNIIERLDAFEVNNVFIEKNISSSSLAKKMKTNTKYLSQIINYNKKKTIVTYINDLRIDYFLQQVKINPKLVNYTIQSIAEEVGFNTAESFSNAFYKKTGLKPSYFIKQLKINK